MWPLLVQAGLGIAGQLIASNQAKQALGGIPAPQPIDIGQLGLSSLNAQAGLAPAQLALERQFRPQYGDAGNAALMAGLFGQQAGIQQNQQDPNFAKLPPDVQQFLASQPNIGAQLAGKSGLDQMKIIYQGMGQPLSTPEDATKFNEWSSEKFGNWHENGSAPGLDALQSWSGATTVGGAQAPAPGLTEILGKTNAALNPGLQPGLDKLTAAAGVAPATVNAPTVAGSPNAAALQGLLGQTAPQVTGAGQNAGMDALTSLIGGTGGYSPIGATGVQAPGGANMAGPTTFAQIPGLASASQANFTGSQAPVSVQAPGPVGAVTGSNVTAPTGFERVGAPSPVGSIAGPGPIDNIVLPMPVGGVQANTGFDKVQAPGTVQSIQAPGTVQVGTNTALQSLMGQGPINRPIQQTLESQAMGDLALGNQLSPDQIRQAQQASRAAANARGMVGSNGAILDEVQRQAALSNELQNQRRGFAQGVEAQGFGQQATQAGQAQGVAGLQNQFLGLGVQAGQSNAANQLAAAQSNQGASLTGNAQALQAGMANQAAGLQGNALNLQGQNINAQTGLANNAQNINAQAQNQQNAQMLAQLGFQTGAQNQQTGLANNAQGLQAGIANQGAGLNLSGLGLQAGQANQANAFNVGATNQGAQIQQGDQALRAGVANQAADTQNNQFNAAAQNQLGQFNVGQTNAQNQMLAQLGLSAGTFNANQANQVGQFGAGQQDIAAARALQAGTTNAQLGQQANLANQSGALQGFGQNVQGAQALGNLGLGAAGLNQNAQQSNQGAFLQNQGQNFNALNALMGADNQLGIVNAGNNLGAQQFNAGQQQQGFQNLLGAQGATQNAAINPLAAMGFNNANAQPQLFNPFDPAILGIFGANQQNAANYGISQGNNQAAINAGLMQGLGGIFGGALNAYGMSQYGGG